MRFKRSLTRLASLLCTLALLLPASTLTASAASAGTLHRSGSTAQARLSQWEMAQLLENSPLLPTDDTDVFISTPSASSPYAAGSVKDSALQAALTRLNALRRIAGLPAVALDPELCQNAQYGAVLLAASAYDHYPPKPGDMSGSFYQTAYSATSTSNIHAGHAMTLTKAVDEFMDDRGNINMDTVGHRRWQLSPLMGKVGFGFVCAPGSVYARYVAEKVLDKSGTPFDYDFIGWPASGDFPSDLFDGDILWTVSLNPDRYQVPDQSQIRVTLTRESDGKAWTFSGSGWQKSEKGAYFHVSTESRGVNNCIIFRPDGVKAYDGVYTVSISGLRTASGQAVADFSYQVNFFNAEAMLINSQDPGFADTADWCREAVSWAVYRGITNGTSPTTFSPDSYCTHAQILTFLWRASGSPDPGVLTGNEYYAKAVSWASSKGMLSSRFDPDARCTRAQAVRYIWQVRDGYYHNGSSLPFTDLGAYYDLSEFAWAVENGVTNGTSSTTFGPNDYCTRGQIVTFLRRAFVHSARLTG